MGKPKYQSFTEYQKIKRVNASILIQGFQSMKAMKVAIDSDDDLEVTPAKKLGQATHAVALEPQWFEATHCVMPNYAIHPGNVDGKGEASTSWSTTWAKQQKKEFLARAAEEKKAVVKREDYDKALAMVDALSGDPFCFEVILGCEKEQTLLGEVAGVQMKARVDLIGTHLADLKTTERIGKVAFGTAAWNLHYPFRMALYRELSRQNGYDFDEAYLLAVQSSPPWDTCAYRLDAEVLDFAWGNVNRKILELKNCIAQDRWPGVNEGHDFLDLFVPQRIQDQAEARTQW